MGVTFFGLLGFFFLAAFAALRIHLWTRAPLLLCVSPPPPSRVLGGKSHFVLSEFGCCVLYPPTLAALRYLFCHSSHPFIPSHLTFIQFLSPSNSHRPLNPALTSETIPPLASSSFLRNHSSSQLPSRQHLVASLCVCLCVEMASWRNSC